MILIQLDAFKIAERGTPAWTFHREAEAAAAAEAAKPPEQKRDETEHAALLARLRAVAKVSPSAFQRIMKWIYLFLFGRRPSFNAIWT